MRVAALDDDEAQVERVEQLLAGAGHRCVGFRAADALIATLRRETYDLLILDWNLPDMSGVDVARWARANLEPAPPILMLTSRTAEEDVVEGLNAGADDYVGKPVQPAVLLARVNALLRRAYPASGATRTETYGDHVFDTAAETASVAGEAVSLTAKEFSLALLLFRNIHRALSRAHILEAVWGRNPDLPTRTLDMHVSRVRTKLGLRPEYGFRLAPVYSYGYRLEQLGEDTGDRNAET